MGRENSIINLDAASNVVTLRNLDGLSKTFKLDEMVALTNMFAGSYAPSELMINLNSSLESSEYVTINVDAPA